MKTILLQVLLLACAPSPAWACPLCRSETGRRVREGIVGPEFGANLAATALPFLIFLGIAGLIHFGIPGMSPREDRT